MEVSINSHTMKATCHWCKIVLYEIKKVETDEDYIIPFIRRRCCEEVFEEGTAVYISKAYEVIQAKSGRYVN